MFYEEIFKLLNKKHVDYIVVGGVALALHGVVRFTADLDLMIDLGEKNIGKFIEVMEELCYKPRIPVRVEELRDAEKRKQWLEERNMKVFSFYHPQQAISLVDIFIYEPIDYEKTKRNVLKIKTGNLSIPVASVNDLIQLKMISGREQDLADIEALKKVGRHEKRRE